MAEVSPYERKRHSLRKLDFVEHGLYFNEVCSPTTDMQPEQFIITTYLEFTKAPKLADIKKLFYEKCTAYERFFSSVTDKGEWEYGSEIDEAYHFSEERIDDVWAEKQKSLQERFDLKKPLWRIHVWRTKEGVDYVVLKTHHSFGDGIRLAKLLDLFMTEKDGAPSTFIEDMKKLVLKQRMGIWDKFCMFFKLFTSCFRLLSAPLLSFETNLVGHTSERHRKGGIPYTRNREYVELPVLRMDEVDAIRKEFKGTVNDLLYSLMAGAHRRYSISKGDPLLQPENERKVISRSFCPHGLPDPKSWAKGDRMGNRFQMVPNCPIPLGLPTIPERVAKTKQIFNSIKKSPYACFQEKAVNFMSKIMPTSITRQTLTDTFARHTCVYSNVRGPPTHVYMCGHKLEKVHTCYNNMINQYLLVSYAGSIYGTLVCDPGFLDPLLIKKCFSDEFTAFQQLYLKDKSA